ncbi:hypothetical protein BDV41DRAFT_538298 [Aspergillus transmontanensis]|uniref:Uncharacterized protein n=1 Tax=Aspergillus transmontanensis TaxID=1034304 RepID=A0A5N6VYW3_9EURO|nr:hypothetical protein BDV41DRAFT_538298 [Aspergillus transmontanensis]
MTLRLLRVRPHAMSTMRRGPLVPLIKTQGLRLLIGLNAGLARPQAPIPWLQADNNLWSSFSFCFHSINRIHHLASSPPHSVLGHSDSEI